MQVGKHIAKREPPTRQEKLDKQHQQINSRKLKSRRQTEETLQNAQENLASRNAEKGKNKRNKIRKTMKQQQGKIPKNLKQRRNMHITPNLRAVTTCPREQ